MIYKLEEKKNILPIITWHLLLYYPISNIFVLSRLFILFFCRLVQQITNIHIKNKLKLTIVG